MVAEDAQEFIFSTSPTLLISQWRTESSMQLMQFELQGQGLTARVEFKGPNELPVPQQIDMTQKLARLIEYLNMTKQ